MKKAIVLSSGGIDSTTCISVAVKDVGKANVTTVSVYYGQKHSKELDCAKKIAEYYGINHRVIDLSNTGIMDGSKCSLLQDNDNIEIEHKSYDEQINKTKDGMVSTYVPFRNGLLLSAVAAIAMSIYPENEVDIYLGAHADDAAGAAYADCSEEFTNAMFKAINIGTYGKVNVNAPLVELNKSQVVKLGLELNSPYHLTWSCYEGKEVQCGECGTCIDRIKAFKDNNAIDPVPYAKEVF